MVVQVKKITETAVLPTRGSSAAAGYDLCADVSSPVTVAPHATELIGTGLMAAIPEGYYGGIFARSGLASREGLRPANCVGVVDADYRGEIKVALHNDSDTPKTVTPGERIAQLVICPFLSVDFEEAGELTDTARGSGGFGSTGK